MAHSYVKLLFHCIFGTKGRAACITPMLRDRLYAYIGGILRHEQGHLLKAGGTANHVHLLIELKGTIAVADAVRLIKANSSKWVHETFRDRADFGWQTGYGAFSVSLSAVDEIVRYIEIQEEHHRTTTFEEEFLAFLRRHGLPCDDRYFSD